MSDELPQLPRAIADRLRELRLHWETLAFAIEQIGEDFSRGRFAELTRSTDPADRARVYAVERGFEVLVNYLTELTVAGLEAAGARNPGAEVSAPREFRALAEQGGISRKLSNQLVALARTRNDLTHDYPSLRANTLHAAVVELREVFPAFMRSYPGWLRERLLQAGDES